MNLVLQLMMGVAVAGVAEGMALADRAGLQQKDVLEILELTNLSCPLLLDKGKGDVHHHLRQSIDFDQKFKLKTEIFTHFDLKN